MADLYNPKMQCEVIGDPAAKPRRDSDLPPDMAYTEKQLVNLVNMMRYAMTSSHNELPTIAKASKHAYPEFAKALEEFSEEARLRMEDSLKASDRLELIERLYRAEQMKTEALAEHLEL